MTNRDEKAFKKAAHCHICGRKYKPDEEENIPVRDHCHITGKYRGSAHKNCKYQQKRLKYLLSFIISKAMTVILLFNN